MKVFNLACDNEHRFEGWFGSAADYDQQLERGLLCCPVCDSHAVRKLPAAPRLNLSSSSSSGDPPRGPNAAQVPLPTDPAQMQALLARVARYIEQNSEDVGERFAEEARRIHQSEAPARTIRGVASVEEVEELTDEGIEVFSIVLPRPLKEPLQ